MAGSMIETRSQVVQSASAVTKSTGGTLTVGPFSRDTIIVRYGAVVTTDFDTDGATITLDASGDYEQEFDLPKDAVAGMSFAKYAVANPDADGFEPIYRGFKSDPAPGQLRLNAGESVTITGQIPSGGGSGAYYLFAEVIQLPLQVGAFYETGA